MFKQSQKLSAGVTLLEMMVALLVLSIGLLGVATLQSRGQQFNQVAYLRTQATFLAYDLMERIKINNTGVYSGECPGDMLCIDCTNCDDQNCNAGELVRYDSSQWCELLVNTLPRPQREQASATITNFVDGDRNGFQIIIRWKNILNSKNDTEARTWRLYL